VCYVHQSSWMDGGSFSGTTPSSITLRRSQTRSSSGTRTSLSLKMVSRSFTVFFIGISSSSPLVFHFLCNTQTSLIFFHVFCFRYIYHELISKEALFASFLPVYVEEWVLDPFLNFMYIDEHDVYPFAHLKHAGWYLDCSKGFVLPSDVHLFTSLNAEAPADVVFHEPVVPEESMKDTKASKVVKEIKSKKVKAASGTQASQAIVSTRSATKAAAEASAAPAATFVGSPSLPLALHALAPSHSTATATATSLTRKKRQRQRVRQRVLHPLRLFLPTVSLRM
jgi:hypothetical protein